MFQKSTKTIDNWEFFAKILVSAIKKYLTVEHNKQLEGG